MSDIKTKEQRLEDAKLFASPLPIGITDFNTWADDIVDLYDLPNNDSIRFTLASIILNVKETEAFKPKHDFFLLIRTAMAKQVASQVFYDLKMKQKAEQEAAEVLAKQQALEATNTTMVVTNETQETNNS